MKRLPYNSGTTSIVWYDIVPQFVYTPDSPTRLRTVQAHSYSHLYPTCLAQVKVHSSGPFIFNELKTNECSHIWKFWQRTSCFYSSKLLPLIPISFFLKRYMWKLDLSEQNGNVISMACKQKKQFCSFSSLPLPTCPIELFLLCLLDNIWGRP